MRTKPATAVTSKSATLNGVIGSSPARASYAFRYGSGAYTATTPVATLERSDAPHAVCVP